MVDIKLITADKCEQCDKTARTIEKVTKDMAGVNFESINVTKRPEAAFEYKASATPSIVINGKVEFIGGVREDELRHRILELM